VDFDAAKFTKTTDIPNGYAGNSRKIHDAQEIGSDQLKNRSIEVKYKTQTGRMIFCSTRIKQIICLRFSTIVLSAGICQDNFNNAVFYKK